MHKHAEMKWEKKRKHPCASESPAGRAFFGFVLLVFGSALLVRSLNINPELTEYINKYLFEWQVILIAIGLTSIIGKPNKGPGLLIFTVGVIFYVRDQTGFAIDIVFWQVLLGVLFLMLGFVIIFMKKPHLRNKKTVSEDVVDDEVIDELAIMGGTERSIITPNFRGGKLVAILGGGNFNLKGSMLAKGKNYLEVVAIFGGFKLTVPEDWNIKLQTVAIFGGIHEKNMPSKTEVSASTDQLIIKGLVIFGGGEIKRKSER